MAGTDKSYLDELTEEERAAVIEGETDDATDAASDTDAAAAKELTDAAAAEATAATEAAKIKPDAELQAAAKAKAEEEAAAAAAAEEIVKVEAEKPADTPKVVTSPAGNAVPDWTKPADADKKLEDIKERKKALTTKFDDGDINGREHLEAMDVLSEEERLIREALFKASLAEDMRAADSTRLKKTWDSAEEMFLAGHTQYKDGTPLHAMLNGELMRLQKAVIEAGGNHLDPALLTQAHESIVAIVSGKPADATAKDTAAAEKDGKEKLKVEAREPPPPTLGKVPAAAINETDGGVFARLDKLADDDPNAYQDLLATMPQAQRDRYYQTAN